MSNLATVALDDQMDLLRFFQTSMGRRYADSLFDQAHEDKTAGSHVHLSILTLSETYAVSSEMCELITAASETIPGYRLHPSDMPSEHGFVWLETPLVVPDTHGDPIVIKAWAWGVARSRDKDGDVVGGIALLLFTDPFDPRDHMHEYIESAQVAWRESGAQHPRYLSMWLGAVAFGTELTNEANPMAKFMASFLRFIHETYVDTRQVDPERPAFKRAARVRKLEPVIKVVRLRKREVKARHEGDGEPIEWSHRWIVQPHWRNQWYPSIQDHRPKYIHSYIKGPDDKPLIVDDKIYVVDR